MDPCPFVRVLIGNLALKFPISTKPSHSRIHPSTSSSFYCKIKLQNFPDQHATIPLVSQDYQPPDPNSVSLSLAACLNFNKSQIDNFLHKKSQSSNHLLSLKIEVYTDPDGTTCGWTNGKLLGRVYVKMDLRGAETRASMIHSGWIPTGENNKKGLCPQLYVSVKAEPDPRFVFKFGGEPECSPQVFQVQGSTKQAVFTCKFSCRNSGDRNLGSRPSISESSTPRKWLQSLGGDKDQSSKERKGWSITIHDLSGSPVAMASMVTPFVPSPNTDRVSRSNPGAWLILRPEQGTWKPWGRLEAWRELGGSDALGYRFHLINDTATTTNTTTLVDSTVSTKSGGKFTMDMTTSVTSTPLNSPHSSFDFGSSSESRSGSRPGSGSGSDFGFGFLPHCPYKGFVMSSTVEGMGKCSKPEVEVGVQHVTCTEDAAAFVALAAAMDLSMDACMLFSQKLRKELRHQSQNFVV